MMYLLSVGPVWEHKECFSSLYPIGNQKMKVSPIEASLVNVCGSDLFVANAARVSFNKASELNPDGSLSEKDTKLINYLAKHNHKSPFNHCFLTFRVKAPIFVARQLVKHKFMPWNEVSRRYVDEEPEFYFPGIWRKKSESKKQGSSEEAVSMSHACAISAETTIKSNLTLYKTLLLEGVCPEQARMVLPQNTMTEWYWSGTLGAFCDMLWLRLKEDTQKETRDVAVLIANEVKKHFPVSYNALRSNYAN